MPKPTQIERVETILWDRWLLVRIYCEDGTVGIGEGGVHGWQRPTKTMLEVMTPYLLGQDPHRIEHHYQFLYRSSHFMGAVVQGALSCGEAAESVRRSPSDMATALPRICFRRPP